MEKLRCRTGETVALYCLLANLVLSLLKGLAGFFGGSKALIADAFHSGSDSLATLVVYISLKISGKPADHDHPYGHGKVEPLAAAFIGVTMITAAAMIGREIIIAILNNNLTTPSIVALAAAAGSIAIKELMFKYTYRAGKSLNSEALIAGALDHRSDVYSSASVLLGLTGSTLGALFGISWLQYLEPLAGILVAVLIIKTALGIMVNALHNLMDAAPAKDIMTRIADLTQEVPGVNGVSWIRGRVVGTKIHIDMAVLVSAQKSVQQGHDIARSVKHALQTNLAHIGEVLVHVNPHQDNDQ